jgi:hypothetical protein
MPPRGHVRSKKLADVAFQAPPFEFVNSSGPPENVRNDSEYSMTIRVHAMRYFLQHRRAASDDGAQDETTRTVPQKPPSAATTGRFKLETWSRKIRKPKPSKARPEKRKEPIEHEITSLMLGKHLRPLMSLIIPSTALTARLLDHCQYCFSLYSLQD